ncbi:RnfH family protein [Undibacterium sp. Jales W-56]|uniref:RnfH family protein n=1 Tax=Undibacterium sp. Jales W-56 TaxID=2897325 RepID=UPI0021CF7E22|nr:RnfH family protein [Undibacterium sp. Jales W-56]MCU6433448.1 RnfH family protein [Undibacterium sp. Jales W-56]
MDDSNKIKVQICFATPDVVTMLEIHIPTDMNLLDAIEQSQICLKHREIDLKTCKFGIFGKLKSPDTLLRDGDRVEIYRALVADPMEARRRRARKQGK